MPSRGLQTLAFPCISSQWTPSVPRMGPVERFSRKAIQALPHSKSLAELKLTPFGCVSAHARELPAQLATRSNKMARDSCLRFPPSLLPITISWIKPERVAQRRPNRDNGASI